MMVNLFSTLSFRLQQDLVHFLKFTFKVFNHTFEAFLTPLVCLISLFKQFHICFVTPIWKVITTCIKKRVTQFFADFLIGNFIKFKTILFNCVKYIIAITSIPMSNEIIVVMSNLYLSSIRFCFNQSYSIGIVPTSVLTPFRPLRMPVKKVHIMMVIGFPFFPKLQYTISIHPRFFNIFKIEKIGFINLRKSDGMCWILHSQYHYKG